jgi:uncharacterized protein (TIGR03083 family)
VRRSDIWVAVHDERALVASMLRDLTPDQWEVASLCDGWRVREVVGHMCGLAHQWRSYGLPIAVGTARAGLRPNRFWDRDARLRGAARPEQLVAELERAVADRRHPWPAFPLAEVVLHGQDIRLPLGMPRTFPTDRLEVIADLLRLPNYPPVPRKLTRGLRLEASDASWAAGRGPLVRGPLAALVLTMAGRRIAVDELRGEGTRILAARTGRM